MKKLFAIVFLSTALMAQAIAPEAIYLTEAQIRRLNDTQAAINILTAQLEAAKKEQQIELLKIQLELGATPDKFGPLEQVGDKLGFKRKAEKN